MRIGVYGGAFNPPHLGHITAARAVSGLLKLDKLLVIPTGHPPHKTLPPGSPGPEQRLELTRLAMEQTGLGEGIEVLDLELRRDQLEEETMKLANRLAEQPAESIRMLKYEINKTYEIMGMRNAMEFAAEMFNLCRIHQVQEQSEFNKMVQEKGLRAAMAWKEAQDGKK